MTYRVIFGSGTRRCGTSIVKAGSVETAIAVARAVCGHGAAVTPATSDLADEDKVFDADNPGKREAEAVVEAAVTAGAVPVMEDGRGRGMVRVRDVASVLSMDEALVDGMLSLAGFERRPDAVCFGEGGAFPVPGAVYVIRGRMVFPSSVFPATGSA